MSGGRSSSSSSSSNSNVTDNSNTQINDTEGLVLNFEGSENNEATIIQSDQGAIKESFNFGESALDSITDVVSNSLDTVDDTSERAFDFGDDTLDRAFDFGDDTVQEAFGFGSDTLDFGRDVVEEAQDITKNALSIAGNAQTNAFSKIKEIASSFTGSNTSTVQLLLAVMAGVGAILLFATIQGFKR